MMRKREKKKYILREEKREKNYDEVLENRKSKNYDNNQIEKRKSKKLNDGKVNTEDRKSRNMSKNLIEDENKKKTSKKTNHENNNKEKRRKEVSEDGRSRKNTFDYTKQKGDRSDRKSAAIVVSFENGDVYDEQDIDISTEEENRRSRSSKKMYDHSNDEEIRRSRSSKKMYDEENRRSRGSKKMYELTNIEEPSKRVSRGIPKTLEDDVEISDNVNKIIVVNRQSDHEEMLRLKHEVEVLKRDLKKERKENKRIRKWLEMSLAKNSMFENFTFSQEDREFIEVVLKKKKKNLKPQLLTERAKNPNSENIPKRGGGFPRHSMNVNEMLFGDSYHQKNMNVKPEACFGVDLNLLTTREDRIPKIVRELVEYICDNLEIEGILRVPGSQDDIVYLRQAYDKGNEVDLSRFDVHTVAGLLKLFFRSLPSPLIPKLHEMQVPLIVKGIKEGKTEDMVITDIKEVVKNLPEPNISVFKYIVEFLIKVSEHSDVNKMTMDNVIKCFVPSVTSAPALFYYPLKYYEYIFS